MDGGSMARPLRIDVEGAWYHVMNRGQELFLDEADRRRFLGAVAELPERLALEVHAFVLTDNHYHRLLRTGEANLSQAIRWLKASYALKFNWAHRSHGTVFQGRFKSVEDIPGSGAQSRMAGNGCDWEKMRRPQPVRTDGRIEGVYGAAHPSRELGESMGRFDRGDRAGGEGVCAETAVGTGVK